MDDDALTSLLQGLQVPEQIEQEEFIRDMHVYRGTQGVPLTRYLNEMEADMLGRMKREVNMDSVRQLQGAVQFIDMVRRHIGAETE